MAGDRMGSITVLPQPRLSLRNVTLRYRTPRRVVTAVHQIGFDVGAGERTVLLGRSGCGKSTLLKAAAGYLLPDEGEVRLDGRAVTGPGPDRIMVFQEFDQLMPWKTVRDNIAFPLVFNGMSQDAAIARAMSYLARVGLTRFADAYPHTLSGGMKQRVAIVRAMALEPRLLLMDEPFAALDALTRRTMQEELLRLWTDTGFTLLFVTHSIEEAIRIGSRILVLSPHPGRLRAELDVPPAVRNGSAEALAAFSTRINTLLFEDAPEALAVIHG